VSTVSDRVPGFELLGPARHMACVLRSKLARATPAAAVRCRCHTESPGEVPHRGAWLCSHEAAGRCAVPWSRPEGGSGHFVLVGGRSRCRGDEGARAPPSIAISNVAGGPPSNVADIVPGASACRALAARSQQVRHLPRLAIQELCAIRCPHEQAHIGPDSPRTIHRAAGVVHGPCDSRRCFSGGRTGVHRGQVTGLSADRETGTVAVMGRGGAWAAVARALRFGGRVADSSRALIS